MKPWRLLSNGTIDLGYKLKISPKSVKAKKKRIQVRDKLMREGLHSSTHKITIEKFDKATNTLMSINTYFHLLWGADYGVDLVGIEVYGLSAVAHITRALLRLHCIELSARLAKCEIDLSYVCNEWIAQPFEPSGTCPQLQGRPVMSILDAAAKVFMQRYLGVELGG